MRKFLAIITLFIFCPDFFSQIKGDSIHIETAYSKKYQGTVTQIDKEGFFIKTSNNREIYLSKLEIKTIKVVLGLVESDNDAKASTTLFIDSNDVHTDDANTLKETPKIEYSEEIKNTAEISEFYIKYELSNFDISSFNSLEKSKDYRKFRRELSRHLYSKNFSLSFSEKANFFKFLPKELEKYPNVDFVNYKRTRRTGTAFIATGVIGVLTGTIWTITIFELTGIGLAGLVVIEIGTLVNLISSKWLYKSFLTYLKERQ